MILRTAAMIALAMMAATAAPTLAAKAHVAVAANFSEPARKIASGFEKATGHKIILSFGSSGAFFTQLSHGAPFHVFLSADRERAVAVERARLAVPGSRFTYATGRLVLYSRTPGLVDGRGTILKSGRFEKIAIADPRTAPYGAAAVDTMRRLGLYDALAPKIVRGSSIAQAYQFTATGVAELGFVALSQVIATSRGSRWVVPATLHGPIEQQAVLLRTGQGNRAATAFMTYLKSPSARAIITRYGYMVS